MKHNQTPNIQTRKLSIGNLPHDGAIQNDLAVDIGVPSKIALVVKTMQAKIILHVADPIIIGRAFTEHEVSPFLDLQLFGADDLGVSRKHLRLWSENGELFIEDLASLNHTHLNGIRLEEFSPQRIRHGDQIVLGGFELRVEFIFDFLA